MATKTKNDIAWEKLFEEYNIINEIHHNGYYVIAAADIKKYREPRLMCKFDHENNLPEIFIDNNVCLLPISRKAYVIGHFHLFEDVKYQRMIPKEVAISPSIQTLNSKDLYSESAALHFAYHSGMIDDFLGEETLHTVSGRMGSGNFDYYVSNKAGHKRQIKVEGAQIEIDGGYEGRSLFALVEAKKEKASDFNVRQLFYPFRVWKGKIHKKIVPIFFTHSNDKFSFFMYEFEDEYSFNSLKLIKQIDYIVEHTSITMEDRDRVVKSATRFVPEPEIPFPQADKFERVVDLLGAFYESDMSKDDIATLQDFDLRQADYYTNACMYLGLANSYKTDDDTMITLTFEGRRIMELPYRHKYLNLAEKILEHEVFKEIYDKQTELMEESKLLKKKLPTRIRNGYIVERMKYHKLYNINSDSTFNRRASTIRGWTNWIRRIHLLDKGI